jgi:hypothetical protein
MEVDTGVTLAEGQSITLDARGSWTADVMARMYYGPDGGPPAPGDSVMPGAPHMALLGKIGQGGTPFVVGSSFSGTAVMAGRLYLMANDSYRGYDDNAGSVFVTVAAEDVPTIVEATVNLDPDTLNLKSKGKWITATIQLPESLNPADIDCATIRIAKIGGASCDPNYAQPLDLKFYPMLGDADADGVADVTVKFDRELLQANLCLDDVSITVEGKLVTGETFTGSDTIRVIQPGKKK